MTDIHPSSIIDPAARLGSGVKIGPFCTVGPDVCLGDSVVLHSHVVVGGHTVIGARTEVFPFASIGLAPQDLKFSGEVSRLEIGSENRIREYVTMNPGTQGGGLVTRVGNNGLFMVGSHVAHDCMVGNNVILANNATLAGHVELGDFAIVGGLAAVHQFVRIGHHAMIGGMSGVEFDVIPFGAVTGERASLSGLNIVGLRRWGYERDVINEMRAAYRDLFEGGGVIQDRLAKVTQTYEGNEAVHQILDFVNAESNRGLTKPKSMASLD